MKLIAHFKPGSTFWPEWKKNGVELVAIEGTQTPKQCRGCSIYTKPHYIAAPSAIPDKEREILARSHAAFSGLDEQDVLDFFNNTGVPLPMFMIRSVVIVD